MWPFKKQSKNKPVKSPTPAPLVRTDDSLSITNPLNPLSPLSPISPLWIGHSDPAPSNNDSHCDHSSNDSSSSYDSGSSFDSGGSFD